MGENSELIYPEIFSNEFVVNIENLKFTIITQQTTYHKPKITDNGILHFHACYEVFLCTKGELHFCVDNRKVTVKSGQMLIVSPEVYHASECVLPDSAVKCLRFVISPNSQKSNFDLYKTVSEILENSSVVIATTNELVDSVVNLNLKSEENDFYSVFKYTCCFLTQLIEITGNVPKRCERVTADNPELRSHKIRVFIDDNINKPITLKQIADYVKLSTRHTNRIIKYKFGCSYKEYITSVRMKKACKLLLEGDCYVSEIAKKVGYSSERGFYTAFKNYSGYLPGEYRKKFNKTGV